MAIAVDHGETGVRCRGTGEVGGNLMQRHGVWQRLHLPYHHFFDAGQGERVHPIFPRQMMAAPRDLFGQDGAFHQQHRHKMRGDASSDQW